MMFAILKQLAENGTPIYGSGVLEVYLMVLDSTIARIRLFARS